MVVVWRGSQRQVDWLHMSSPILPPTAGFLAKEKQKPEALEDRKMKTVLWAEKAALPGQQALCKLSLERAVWLFVTGNATLPSGACGEKVF